MTTNPSSDDALDALLADFQQHVDADGPLSAAELFQRRQKLIEEHPDLAEALRQYFAQHDGLKQAISAGVETEGYPQTVAAPTRGDSLIYWGDYEIREEIARGGMGVVYRARQTTLDRIVAVKQILPGHSDTARERFQREARTMAGLRHANIVEIHEVQDHEGCPYFSMEFLPGGSLADRLRKSPLPPRHAASLMLKIAEAVSYAHDHGVLHRDLKPGNILFDETGEPHVGDFGLALSLETPSDLTDPGQPPGTPAYMSPEQVRGDRSTLSIHSDVFSLGVILYETLSGDRPFTGINRHEVEQQVLHKNQRSLRELDPAIPLDLATICERCLEKDPQRRLTSCRELAHCLNDFLANRPIPIRPISQLERAWRWCQRNPLVATLGLGLVAATIVAIAAGVRANREAVRAIVSAAETKEVNAQLVKGVQRNQELATKYAEIAHEEQEKRILADSMRLATEARAVSATAPIRATRLALEAALPFLDKPVEAPHEIEQTLRDMSAKVHGIPLPDAPASEIWLSRITPDRKHVYAVGRSNRPENDDIVIWVWTDLDRIPYPLPPIELKYPGWPRARDHRDRRRYWPPLPSETVPSSDDRPSAPQEVVEYEKAERMKVICSHDARWLIAYCMGGRRVRFWNLLGPRGPQGGQYYDYLAAHSITDVQMPPNQELLCISSTRDAHSSLWAGDGPPAPGEHWLLDLKATVPTTIAKFNCNAIWFSDSGRWLAAHEMDSTRETMIYDLYAGAMHEPSVKLPGSQAVVFSPQSDWIVTSNPKHEQLHRLPLAFHNVPTPADEPPRDKKWPPLQWEGYLYAVSPSGKWLVTVKDRIARVLDVYSDDPSGNPWILGGEDQILRTPNWTSIAFDESETRVVLADLDKELHVFERGGSRTSVEAPGSFNHQRISFLPDNRILYSGNILHLAENAQPDQRGNTRFWLDEPKPQQNRSSLILPPPVRAVTDGNSGLEYLRPDLPVLTRGGMLQFEDVGPVMAHDSSIVDADVAIRAPRPFEPGSPSLQSLESPFESLVLTRDSSGSLRIWPKRAVRALSDRFGVEFRNLDVLRDSLSPDRKWLSHRAAESPHDHLDRTRQIVAMRSLDLFTHGSVVALKRDLSAVVGLMDFGRIQVQPLMGRPATDKIRLERHAFDSDSGVALPVRGYEVMGGSREWLLGNVHASSDGRHFAMVHHGVGFDRLTVQTVDSEGMTSPRSLLLYHAVPRGMAFRGNCDPGELAFSPDGRWLVWRRRSAGSFMVFHYDPERRRFESRLKIQEPPDSHWNCCDHGFPRFVFTPDSRWLLWNRDKTEYGRPRVTLFRCDSLRGHISQAWALGKEEALVDGGRFEEGSRWLILGHHSDELAIRLLPDPVDLNQSLIRLPNRARRAWPAGEGRWLVCEEDREFTVFDAPTRQVAFKSHGHFSASGQWLIGRQDSENLTLFLWDLRGELRRYPVPSMASRIREEVGSRFKSDDDLTRRHPGWKQGVAFDGVSSRKGDFAVLDFEDTISETPVPEGLYLKASLLLRVLPPGQGIEHRWSNGPSFRHGDHYWNVVLSADGRRLFRLDYDGSIVVTEFNEHDPLRIQSTRRLIATPPSANDPSTWEFLRPTEGECRHGSGPIQYVEPYVVHFTRRDILAWDLRRPERELLAQVIRFDYPRQFSGLVTPDGTWISVAADSASYNQPPHDDYRPLSFEALVSWAEAKVGPTARE